MDDLTALLASGPSSASSRSRQINNANGRRRLLEAAESHKPEAESIANRQDLDFDSKKHIVKKTLKTWRGVINSWVNFSEEVLGRTADHPEHGLRYFSRGGPLPDRVLLRKYLIWYCMTSKGGRIEKVILDGTNPIRQPLAFKTVVNRLEILSSCFSYYNRKLSQELFSDTKSYITSELAKEQSLNTGTLSKPLAYTEDVDLLIQRLFCPGLQWLWHSLKYLLSFILLMNLLVDTSARIGEFLVNDQDPLHLLHWSDLEIFLFPMDGVQSNQIFIKIHQGWRKNEKKIRGKYKTSVVRLLPAKYALSDSCRLLLILGLIEGHFVGISSWKDLMMVRASPDGTQLAIKPSSRDLPVFHMGLFPNDSVEDPLTFGWFQRILNHMSVVLGLKERLTSYSFRRFIGFILDATQDEETRRQHMGHAPGSGAWSYYKSRTSQIDVQALARGLELISVLKLSSVTLGRIREGIPSSLSEAGFDSVESDASMIAARLALDDARAAVLARHPSIKKSQEVDDGLYEEYSRANRAHYNLRRTLQQRVFKREVEEYIRAASLAANDSAVTSAPPEASSSHQILPADESTALIPKTFHPSTAPAQPYAEELTNVIDVNILNEEHWEDEIGRGPIMMDDNIFSNADSLGDINPMMSLDQTDALLASISMADELDGNESDEEEADGGQYVAEFSNGEINGVEDAAAREAAAQLSTMVDIGTLKSSSSLHLNEHLRQHLVDAYSVGPLSGRIRRYCYSPMAFQLDAVHKSIVAGEMDDAAVSDLLTTLFSSDRFPYDLPPHWQPAKGQTQCVFGCGTPVLTADGRCNANAYGHTKSCATAEAKRLSEEMFDDMINKSFRHCDWKSRLRKKDGSKGLCGHLAANARAQHRHNFSSHVNNSKRVQSNFTCRFGDCGDNPSIFQTAQELGNHFTRIHSIPDFTAPSTLTAWCPFCDVYLINSTASVTHDEHFLSHADEVFDTVSRSGYLNVLLGNERIMKHAYCIWCLYDEKKSPLARFGGYSHQSNLPTHLWQEHTSEFVLDTEHQYPCPASAAAGAQVPHCAYEGLMTGAQLLDHIEVVHKLPLPRREPPLGTRLYTFVKNAKRGAEGLDDEEEEDADPMTTAPKLDRPTLASIPVNKPRGRPKKVRTDAADKNAQKGLKKVAQVKRKGGGERKEIHDDLIDPLLRNV